MIKKVALLLPILSGMLWGSTGIYVRFLQEYGFNSSMVIALKMIPTTIVLFICIGIGKRELFKIRLKDAWLFVVSGIFGMLLLNFGYNSAVEKLTLSFAAVLLSLSPIFVMIFAAILFKEKITQKKVFSTALAVVGCVLVSGILEKSGETAMSIEGILLGLSAAVFYAIYSIVSKMAMEKGYTVFTIIFYSTLPITIIMLNFIDWETVGSFIEDAPVQNSVFILAYAVGTMILPYVLYTAALAYVDAGKVAILGAGGEPSAAMVLGCIFFSEIPSLLSVAGLVITIVALTFICMPDKDKRTTHV